MVSITEMASGEFTMQCVGSSLYHYYFPILTKATELFIIAIYQSRLMPILQWSRPNDDETEGQVAILGAPLDISKQLNNILFILNLIK